MRGCAATLDVQDIALHVVRQIWSLSEQQMQAMPQGPAGHTASLSGVLTELVGQSLVRCRFAHGESELRKPKEASDDPTRIVATIEVRAEPCHGKEPAANHSCEPCTPPRTFPPTARGPSDRRKLTSVAQFNRMLERRRNAACSPTSRCRISRQVDGLIKERAQRRQTA